MRASYLILAGLSSWAALAATADAQGRGGRAAETATLHDEVTVMRVLPRALQVMTADQQQWLVSVPTRAEDVVFQGGATLQFLQPGMTVRFHTTFQKTDRRRKEYQATRPVTKLEIISITEASPPGLYPDDAMADADRDPEREEAGNVIDGHGKDKGVRKAAGKKEGVHAAGEDIACLVIGVLREYKNNKIKVMAGQFPVIAELPETAEVSVDVRHALWVRPGDKIELSARYFPAMRGRAEGQRMIITAAVPLTPDDSVAKGHRRGHNKTDDDDDDDARHAPTRKEPE